MISRCLNRLTHGLFPIVLAGFVWTVVAAGAPDKIPGKVMQALKARFPNAEIAKWTAETEGGIVLYDIEFKQAGRNLEADIREDGTIDNWEREIPIKGLPAVVRSAVDSRYRGAAIKQVMAATTVKDKRDVLEGYEVVLETADKKGVEVTVAPNGKILEDSGLKK